MTYSRQGKKKKKKERKERKTTQIQILSIIIIRVAANGVLRSPPYKPLHRGPSDSFVSFFLLSPTENPKTIRSYPLGSLIAAL